MLYRVLSASFAVACTTITFHSNAQAADSFRYVSINGSNANPCTLAQPCRSLQQGISHTPALGELHILDSGFYGNNATVNKSMAIVGNGHTITLGTAITIDRANAVVAVRRLAINGEGNTSIGIAIAAAGTVHIEHCDVYRHTSHGIALNSSNTVLSVTDTTSRNNGGSGLSFTGNGTSKLVVENAHFANNQANGVTADGGESAISRSVATGNGVGVRVSNGRMNVTSTTAAHNENYGFIGGANSQMTLESVMSRDHTVGLLVGTTSTARISNSTFTNNATGILNQGIVETRQNNRITGNTNNTGGNVVTPLAGI